MRAVVLALVSALLFGASTPASKALLGRFTPQQLAGLLYLGAALGVFPRIAHEWRASRRGAADGGASVAPHGDLTYATRGARLLAGAVVCGGLLGPLLLLLGLRSANAGAVSLLLNAELAATAVLGVLLFREHLHRLGWLAIAGIAAAGALISGGSGVPGVRSGLLVLGACVCWGLDNHLTALVDGITPAQSTWWKGSVAGAFNLAVGCWLAPLHAPIGSIALALGVGALAYGVSIALYIAAAQQLGATRAQGLFATAPFLGTLLSVVFLREALPPLYWGAGTLLAISVLLLFASRHAHEHAHDAVAHSHGHRHDDGHHDHEHPGQPASTRHTHPHSHEPVVHAHPHWPDLHHRHRH